MLSQPSQLFSTSLILKIFYCAEADGLALFISEQHIRAVLYEMVP